MTSFDRRLQRLEELERRYRLEGEIEDLAAFYGLSVMEVRSELDRYLDLPTMPFEQHVRAVAGDLGLDPAEFMAATEANVAAYETWRETR